MQVPLSLSNPKGDLIHLASVTWQREICFWFCSHLKGIFSARKIMSIPCTALCLSLYSRSCIILFTCETLGFCLLTWEKILNCQKSAKEVRKKITIHLKKRKVDIEITQKSYWNLIATELLSLWFIFSQQILWLLQKFCLYDLYLANGY